MHVPSKACRFNKVEQATMQLISYCKSKNWAGYDPYDGLNSRLFEKAPFLDNKFFRLLLIQFVKRFPINLRPLLLVPRQQNPKAIALFLMAFLRLQRLGLLPEQDLVLYMADRLQALRSRNTDYWCWGYNFPWQTRRNVVPRMAPNLVSTCFGANALLDLYEATDDPEYLHVATSAAKYVLNELYWEDNDVASFSYPLPSLRTQVHNANFLGAALLCRIYYYTGKTVFYSAALNVTRYSVSMQYDNGQWDYGHLSTQSWVDNFHTGYNLCALQNICRYANTNEFESAIRLGFDFYRNHFFQADGVAKYFHNRTYPIDIHSIAQSIITLLSFTNLYETNFTIASSILKWSMKHMWDDEGFFYFQKWPNLLNKISYMRWSQAWMLLALSCFLAHVEITND